jgi:hypothetical protein
MSDDSSLRAAVERSRVASATLAGLGNARRGQFLRETFDGSRVVAALRATVRQAHEALVNSVILRRLWEAGGDFSQMVASASVTQLADSITTVATHSWLYRWLTAEPKQEVIVIDLRETLTVAPFIVALDRALERALPARAHSLLVRGATRAARSVRAAPIRVASGLLLVVVLVSLLADIALGALMLLELGAQLLGALAGLAGLRVEASWVELRETRLARLVAAALEPPPPPERED